MVRIFKCREMVEDEGNGHGGNGCGIMDTIRPRIEGKSVDTIQKACVSSEMRKSVVQLNGQLQYSEKRSGFCQGGEGPNDLTRAGGLTQAKLISRKQPVRTGGGGAGLFHCLAGESLVPVRAGRGETRENSDTSGLNNDIVATVATVSSGTSGRMYRTDGQMDKVTKKQCKIVDAIRPCIEGKSTDRVQRACVSSEMQKGTDGLGGSQYLEKRSEFNQRGRCLNDMAQAGVMTQAKFILQKQPVGAGRHSFADTMSLVPVGSGGGNTRTNSDTSGPNNGTVVGAAVSSGAFSRMHQTDGQLDRENRDKVQDKE